MDQTPVLQKTTIPVSLAGLSQAYQARFLAAYGRILQALDDAQGTDLLLEAHDIAYRLGQGGLSETESPFQNDESLNRSFELGRSDAAELREMQACRPCHSCAPCPIHG